jgi:hypothetical protein
MKKVFLIIGISLIGCKKENPQPKQNCNCGLIESDNIQDYSIVVRNDCSGNSKKFYLTEGDYMNAYPGNKQCFSDVASW